MIFHIVISLISLSTLHLAPQSNAIHTVLFAASFCCFFLLLQSPRNPRDYFAMFDGAELVSSDGSSSSHLELVCCKCVDTYVTVKKNQNQICWKFQKVRNVKFNMKLAVDIVWTLVSP
jgi:hypothetical protein